VTRKNAFIELSLQWEKKYVYKMHVEGNSRRKTSPAAAAAAAAGGAVRFAGQRRSVGPRAVVVIE